MALRRFPVVWVEPNRLRLSGGFLVGRRLLGEPLPQISGNVSPKRDRRLMPVLGIPGGEPQAGRVGVEGQLPDGDRSQFALAEVGEHQRLVDQRPLVPEPSRYFAV